MEVVVVFPWVPAIAIPYFIRINSASISARGMTGIFRARAASTSGLSGRTAEEIVFGDVSTGAQNDLQRATDLVRHMVAQYGMSDKVGLMTFDGGGRPALLPGLSQPREHSEEMARLLDTEAGRILGEAHVKVSALLTEKRSLLEELARRLLEKEVVERDELKALLAGATQS